MKSYIGDSVYAEVVDDGTLVLTTENGYGASNTIYLEPEVWSGLVEFMKRGASNDTATDQD